MAITLDKNQRLVHVATVGYRDEKNKKVVKTQKLYAIEGVEDSNERQKLTPEEQARCEEIVADMAEQFGKTMRRLANA